jgi:hypothetical protein
LRTPGKRNRRFLAGFLAAAMAISVSPLVGGIASADEHLADPTVEGGFCDGAPETNDFPDVTAADPANEEISCMTADELPVPIIRGFEDGTYRPNASTLRRHMALLLERLVDLANELETGDLPELPEWDGEHVFTDTEPEEEEQANAIHRLAAADPEIVRGFPDGSYRPAQPVLRRQMALFVIRTYAFLHGMDEVPTYEGEDNFPDIADEEDEQRNAINLVSELGIFQGGADGNFNPGADLNRRQIALVVSRLLQVLYSEGLIESPFAEAVTNAGVVVAFDNAANTYTFVPDGGNEAVTVTHNPAEDTYSVDGAPATNAVFEANISLGDRIEVTDNEDGSQHHALTNQTPPDEGVVGNINTNQVTAFPQTYAIIDPVTGFQLSDFIDYVATCDLYEVDGASATLATFEANISEGDTLERSEMGVNDVCSLTNHTVAGTVQDLTKNATEAQFRIGNLGDSYDDLQSRTGVLGTFDGHFLVDPGYTQTFTVDGASATRAQFIAALSVGDQASYERSGGTETFTLVNTAPTTTTGVGTGTFALGGAGGTINVLPEGSTTQQTVNYTAGAQFLVDGVLSTEAEFEAAYSPGDDVSYTPADAATSTVERISLVNQPLAGLVDDINTGADTYDVENQAGGVIYDNLNYTAAIFGGTDRYFVNGTEVTLVAFETALTNCAAAAPNRCSIQVADTALATEHRLTTLS